MIKQKLFLVIIICLSKLTMFITNKYLCAENVLMNRTDYILKIMTINGVIRTVLIGPSQSSEVVGASLVYSSILTPLLSGLTMDRMLDLFDFFI